MMQHKLSVVGIAMACGLGAACGPSSAMMGNDDDAANNGQPDGGHVADAGHQPDVPIFIPPDAHIGPDAQCDQTTPITATMTMTTPDMLIVLDKSGSMNMSIGGGSSTSRISAVKSALDTIVPATNAAIHWGLMVFPSNNSCGSGTISVGIAANNAGPVKTAVDNVSPGGSTPTPGSLQAALTYYQGISVNPDGRYVLLATDGEPNCAQGDPMGSTATESATAAAALKNAGIKVFVIGIGTDVSSSTTLTNIAQSGGTMMFYPATSPASLQSALNSITGSVQMPSCNYMLQTRPDDPSKLSVTLDGQTIPRNPSHNTGWDYDAATNSIIFYGTTCNMVKSGTAHTVGVDYGCGGPIISREAN